MALTRRLFLERLTGTAGAAMTYEAMAAIGLLPTAGRRRGRSSCAARPTARRSLMLGGGLAGMSTAFELVKLGYDCRVLEGRAGRAAAATPSGAGRSAKRPARPRSAGSTKGSTTTRVRCGSRITIRSRSGTAASSGVPVEVFVNENEAAFYYQTKSTTLGGQRLRSREVRADMSGYAAELLSKAVSLHALDEPLTDADREALLEYLRRAGALDEKAIYKGSARRGYTTMPGAGDLPGAPSTPLPLDQLLESKTGLYLQTEFLTQSTMFQVVGGTDRLAAAFAARLGNRIIYGAEIHEITQREHGVTITYAKDGTLHQTGASYGVCAMPLPVVASLRVADFEPEVKTAIAAVPYASAGKIGLQFSRRFWEEDDSIFGGISKTDQEIAQIVYPSSGYLGAKGVLIGYYQNGANAAAMARRTTAERRDLALSQGERIHPQYRKHFETAFPVSWQNVPWSRGGWAQYSPDAAEERLSDLLPPVRPGVFRRRSRQLLERLDGRRAGVGTTGRAGHSHAGGAGAQRRGMSAGHVGGVGIRAVHPVLVTARRRRATRHRGRAWRHGNRRPSRRRATPPAPSSADATG